MDQINEKEREALTTFQGRISDILDRMGSYEKHDLSLLRWLRARELNIDEAEGRLRKALQWREEEQIDTILTDWKAPSLFNQEFILKISGVDKDGCPVCVIPGGKWDVVGVLEQGYREEYIKFWIQILEQGVQFMKDSLKSGQDGGSLVTQFTLIADLEGLEMKQVISREHIELELEVLRLVECRYPETLKAAYVINAPTIFELGFALARPFLTGRTLSKVNIYGSNRSEWRAKLLEIIDVEQMPASCGGSNTSCPNYTLEMGLDLESGLKKYKAKRFPESEFQTILIPAGTYINIDFDVDKMDTRISWNFKSDDFDIGFKFLYEGTEEIFSSERVDSHLDTMTGTYPDAKTGTYTLHFDNSYSKWRSKTVHYAYDVAPDDENTEQ